MSLFERPEGKRLVGSATKDATTAYSQTRGRALDRGHYSDFRGGIKLSALGLGTFPGVASDAADRALADIVHRALAGGVNVIDTATHYRYGRSLPAIAEGLKRAVDEGVDRSALWLMSKGGFVDFAGAAPADVEGYMRREIIAKDLATPAECAGAHVLSRRYIRAQIDKSRARLRVETLDTFLVDQPEVHIPVWGKAAVLAKLGEIFIELEQAVKEGALNFYGVSSFHAFRVPTDDPLFISLAALVAQAKKAAKEVVGHEHHHLALIELPFNAVMLDGFTRFNQITGEGDEASTLQGALQLQLYTVASHGLFKGHLAKQPMDILVQAMPTYVNDAQRALQFNRSTPGLGTTLVGISSPSHLDDVLAVARTPLLSHKSYMALYRRAEN